MRVGFNFLSVLRRMPPLGKHATERNATFLDLYDIIPHGIVPHFRIPYSCE